MTTIDGILVPPDEPASDTGTDAPASVDTRRPRVWLRILLSFIVGFGLALAVAGAGLYAYDASHDGLVLPGDFISAAEETGIILPLGMWVLEQACRQLRDWQLADSRWSALTMSVNLSPKLFAQHDLVGPGRGHGRLGQRELEHPFGLDERAQLQPAGGQGCGHGVSPVMCLRA